MSDQPIDSAKRTWIIASGCAGVVGAGRLLRVGHGTCDGAVIDGATGVPSAAWRIPMSAVGWKGLLNGWPWFRRMSL